ncbi:helix-turn-helix transcriptional regulator [Shewanella sp. Isolate11]|uniref:helix-turn-helix domain-containing protein n=1 Tax=Shewanella sp. Isolate11 TaxID=2908530 RepID=UPI001EFE2930|nr:helix-turn-helix transcriptional regulator [Shewanella sp. Isolate11]MCG9695368.1 helix-turn-helix domain-containing protein [Shewanella sp. Isolate11]
MILSEKIIKLRKQLGWSQEELADKVNVSRQSVSKWESTNSIPDLNKIIRLAGLFNVSTDFLLKDDIDTAEYLSENSEADVIQVNLEQALSYIDNITAQAQLTAKGVACFVCSAVPLFFLLALSKNENVALDADIAVALGLISIFIMVAAGIRQVISTNQYSSALAPIDKAPFELAYGVHSACGEKQEAFTPTYNNKLSLAITLFITSTIPLLLVVIFIGQDYLVLLMLPVLLFIVTAGLWIIIPASAQHEAYKHILNEGDKNRDLTHSERHAIKLAPFYWPLTVAIYLGWSLWTMNWGVTWIIWPVAGVLFAALVGLMGLLEKDRS